MTDISALPLLKGEKALVTGIANDQSMAWDTPRPSARSERTSPSPI